MRKQSKPKILVGINTLTEVNQSAYSNHLEVFYRLGRTYTKYDFAICSPRRMSIDNMRNFAAKAAVESGFEYLFFIDDDVLIPSDSLGHLLALDSDIAAGITLIRGYPYDPMLFSFKPGRKNSRIVEYKTLIRKDGSLRREDGLDAVGFSCCLIKTSLLKAVELPWFLTGTNFTEDVFFCQRASEAKKDLTIAASDLIQTQHILGSEIICPANAIARRQYDERLNPGLKKASKSGNTLVVNSPLVDSFLNARATQLAKYVRKNAK